MSDNDISPEAREKFNDLDNRIDTLSEGLALLKNELEPVNNPFFADLISRLEEQLNEAENKKDEEPEAQDKEVEVEDGNLIEQIAADTTSDHTFTTKWVEVGSDSTPSFTSCNDITKIEDAQNALVEAYNYHTNPENQTSEFNFKTGDFLILKCSETPENAIEYGKDSDLESGEERDLAFGYSLKASCHYIGVVLDTTLSMQMVEPGEEGNKFTVSLSPDGENTENYPELYVWKSCSCKIPVDEDGEPLESEKGQVTLDTIVPDIELNESSEISPVVVLEAVTFDESSSDSVDLPDELVSMKNFGSNSPEITDELIESVKLFRQSALSSGRIQQYRDVKLTTTVTEYTYDEDKLSFDKNSTNVVFKKTELIPKIFRQNKLTLSADECANLKATQDLEFVEEWEVLTKNFTSTPDQIDNQNISGSQPSTSTTTFNEFSPTIETVEGNILFEITETAVSLGNVSSLYYFAPNITLANADKIKAEDTVTNALRWENLRTEVGQIKADNTRPISVYGQPVSKDINYASGLLIEQEDEEKKSEELMFSFDLPAFNKTLGLNLQDQYVNSEFSVIELVEEQDEDGNDIIVEQDPEHIDVANSQAWQALNLQLLNRKKLHFTDGLLKDHDNFDDVGQVAQLFHHRVVLPFLNTHNVYDGETNIFHNKAFQLVEDIEEDGKVNIRLNYKDTYKPHLFDLGLYRGVEGQDIVDADWLEAAVLELTSVPKGDNGNYNVSPKISLGVLPILDELGESLGPIVWQPVSVVNQKELDFEKGLLDETDDIAAATTVELPIINDEYVGEGAVPYLTDMQIQSITAGDKKEDGSIPLTFVFSPHKKNLNFESGLYINSDFATTASSSSSVDLQLEGVLVEGDSNTHALKTKLSLGNTEAIADSVFKHLPIASVATKDFQFNAGLLKQVDDVDTKIGDSVLVEQIDASKVSSASQTVSTGSTITSVAHAAEEDVHTLTFTQSSSTVDLDHNTGLFTGSSNADTVETDDVTVSFDLSNMITGNDQTHGLKSKVSLGVFQDLTSSVFQRVSLYNVNTNVYGFEKGLLKTVDEQVSIYQPQHIPIIDPNEVSSDSPDVVTNFDLSDITATRDSSGNFDLDFSFTQSAKGLNHDTGLFTGIDETATDTTVTKTVNLDLGSVIVEGLDSDVFHTPVISLGTLGTSGVWVDREIVVASTKKASYVDGLLKTQAEEIVTDSINIPVVNTSAVSTSNPELVTDIDITNIQATSQNADGTYNVDFEFTLTKAPFNHDTGLFTGKGSDVNSTISDSAIMDLGTVVVTGDSGSYYSTPKISLGNLGTAATALINQSVDVVNTKEYDYTNGLLKTVADVENVTKVDIPVINTSVVSTSTPDVVTNIDISRIQSTSQNADGTYNVTFEFDVDKQPFDYESGLFLGAGTASTTTISDSAIMDLGNVVITGNTGSHFSTAKVSLGNLQTGNTVLLNQAIDVVNTKEYSYTNGVLKTVSNVENVLASVDIPVINTDAVSTSDPDVITGFDLSDITATRDENGNFDLDFSFTQSAKGLNHDTGLFTGIDTNATDTTVNKTVNLDLGSVIVEGDTNSHLSSAIVSLGNLVSTNTMFKDLNIGVVNKIKYNYTDGLLKTTTELENTDEEYVASEVAIPVIDTDKVSTGSVTTSDVSIKEISMSENDETGNQQLTLTFTKSQTKSNFDTGLFTGLAQDQPADVDFSSSVEFVANDLFSGQTTSVLSEPKVSLGNVQTVESSVLANLPVTLQTQKKLNFSNGILDTVVIEEEPFTWLHTVDVPIIDTEKVGTDSISLAKNISLKTANSTGRDTQNPHLYGIEFTFETTYETADFDTGLFTQVEDGSPVESTATALIDLTDIGFGSFTDDTTFVNTQVSIGNMVSHSDVFKDLLYGIKNTGTLDIEDGLVTGVNAVPEDSLTNRSLFRVPTIDPDAVLTGSESVDSVSITSGSANYFPASNTDPATIQITLNTATDTSTFDVDTGLIKEVTATSNTGSVVIDLDATTLVSGLAPSGANLDSLKTDTSLTIDEPTEIYEGWPGVWKNRTVNLNKGSQLEFTDGSLASVTALTDDKDTVTFKEIDYSQVENVFLEDTNLFVGFSESDDPSTVTKNTADGNLDITIPFKGNFRKFSVDSGLVTRFDESLTTEDLSLSFNLNIASEITEAVEAVVIDGNFEFDGATGPIYSDALLGSADTLTGRAVKTRNVTLTPQQRIEANAGLVKELKDYDANDSEFDGKVSSAAIPIIDLNAVVKDATIEASSLASVSHTTTEDEIAGTTTVQFKYSTDKSTITVQDGLVTANSAEAGSLKNLGEPIVLNTGGGAVLGIDSTVDVLAGQEFKIGYVPRQDGVLQWQLYAKPTYQRLTFTNGSLTATQNVEGSQFEKAGSFYAQYGTWETVKVCQDGNTTNKTILVAP